MMQESPGCLIGFVHIAKGISPLVRLLRRRAVSYIGPMTVGRPSGLSDIMIFCQLPQGFLRPAVRVFPSSHHPGLFGL